MDGGCSMDVWFEGEAPIATSIEAVGRDLEDFGRHCAAIVALVPGITSVELVSASQDAATLRTNEGVMTRSAVQLTVADTITLEFDEVYEAGSKVTASSHFRHTFTPAAGGVSHRLVISDVTAPGVLGAMYRRFGAGKMGAAFLDAYAEHLGDAA